jgi:hypothetical protein
MKTRVAIFIKGQNTALIGLNTSREQNFLARSDPRFQASAEMPSISICDTKEIAETSFAHSLRLTLDRGWQLAYYGPVLRG